MADYPIPHFTLEFSQKFIETCPDDVLAALYHIWHSLDLHNYFINRELCVRAGTVSLFDESDAKSADALAAASFMRIVYRSVSESDICLN